MSDLYARIPTSARKTVPTARGFKSTGIEAEVCSWDGKIVSNIWWNEKDQKFHFSVTMDEHHGHGDKSIICQGIVGDRLSIFGPCIDHTKIVKEKMREAFKNTATT